MSWVQLTALAWNLEHLDGLLEQFGHDPELVLSRYALSRSERQAILDRDAHALLAAGMNPVALRNLMVLLGVRHADMFQRRVSGAAT